METQHNPWPSIGSLANVAASHTHAQETWSVEPPAITYQAKIKLHGTNAGIQILPDGTVLAQSRRRLLDGAPDSSLNGFREFVDDTAPLWRELAAYAAARSRVTVFGEWAGPGVQRGVAVSDIPRKIFAVFAVQFDEPGEDRLITNYDPEYIQSFVPKHARIHTLPWLEGSRVRIDFSAPDKDVLKSVEDLVLQVEKEDPWVSEVFGVSGIGEGLVYYPTPGGMAKAVLTSKEDLGRMLWKAKGEKHTVAGKKPRVSVDPETAANAQAYAELMVPEARLQQGIQEVFGDDPFDQKGTGAFIKWIVQDVQKEGALELEASGLTWKQVGGTVAKKAREWFLAKCAGAWA